MIMAGEYFKSTNHCPYLLGVWRQKFQSLEGVQEQHGRAIDILIIQKKMTGNGEA